MPYLPPSHSADSPPPNHTPTTTPTTAPTTHHRRIRSAAPSFSDEKGPGAFAPLGRLPRRQRQDKKPLFEIAPDDNDNEYDHQDSFDSFPPLSLSFTTAPTPPILTSPRPPPPLLVTSAASPPTSPPTPPTLSAVSHIPFPTSSPVVSLLFTLSASRFPASRFPLPYRYRWLTMAG